MTLRIGLIGCGNIGEQHAHGYLRLTEAARIAAVCDVDTGSARAIASLAGAEVFSNVDEMLARGEVDAVDICLPHHLHTDAIVASARAGKHILCEKPICLAMEDAETIERVVSEAGVTFMAAHNLLFEPAIQEARRLLSEGALGRLYEVRTVGVSRWRPRPRLKELGWRARAAQMGGGELMDMGYHAAYALTYLTGESPTAVVATLSKHRLDEMEGEDSAQVLLCFESGTVGHIVTSYAYEPPANAWSFHAIGEGGQLYGSTNELFFKPVGFEPTGLTFPTVENEYWVEVEHFVACVRGGHEPLQTLADGISTLRVILAAYESARERRFVMIAPAVEFVDGWHGRSPAIAGERRRLDPRLA